VRTAGFESTDFWFRYLDTSIVLRIITKDDYTIVGTLRKIVFDRMGSNISQNVGRIKIVQTTEPVDGIKYINSRWYVDIETADIISVQEHDEWMLEEILKL